MIPIEHPSNNHEFTKPKDWDAEKEGTDCRTLSVTLIRHPDRILSFWQPTPEELKMLNEGGTVCLHIFGQGMPPVWVEATKVS